MLTPDQDQALKDTAGGRQAAPHRHADAVLRRQPPEPRQAPRRAAADHTLLEQAIPLLQQIADAASPPAETAPTEATT